MGSLIALLIAIALADSTTMLPLGILVMAALLGTAKGFPKSGAFLAGIFVCYFISGLVLLYGLDILLDKLEPMIDEWWNRPSDLQVVLQLVMSISVIVFAFKLAPAREGDRSPDSPAEVTLTQAFTLGVSITIVGLPGAFPYFGGIDSILDADLDLAGNLTMLAMYNVAFVAPLSLVLFISRVAPNYSEKILGWVTDKADRWGHRVIVAILVMVGLVFLIDAIGWLLGHPLLPTFEMPDAAPG